MQFGRTKILRDEEEINESNIVRVLLETFQVHLINRGAIDTMYKYYKGRQPILERVKTIRPEICNRIVENRANEIVTFKTGYLIGEPVQYISRGSDQETSDAIGRLNDLMSLAGKATLDKSLAEWMYIAGTGYRMVLPNSRQIRQQVIPMLKNSDVTFDEDEAPFNIYTLDPRNCYVVYNSGLGEPPLMAVRYVTRQDRTVIFTVFTDTRRFDLKGAYGSGAAALERTSPNVMGYIPIIEYPLCSARLGIFEIVMPLLNAINTIQSNRLDGIEQFVQSLLVLYNADIDDEAAKTLRESGLIKLKNYGDNKADIKEIAQQLDQQQTQTLVDYLYQTILNIVGMPNRNGGSSTSDTGAAVQLRDGWSTAEARAKGDELMFKGSEREFLKIVLKILRDSVGTPLKLVDIETKFTRRNYEAIQTKAQVLDLMLNNDKIAPSLAFAHCGLFSDPESAYQMSRNYSEAVLRAEIEAEAETMGEVKTAREAEMLPEKETKAGDAIA